MLKTLSDNLPRRSTGPWVPEIPRTYVLGHSEGELRRLATQSAFIDDLTEHVLKRAASPRA